MKHNFRNRQKLLVIINDKIKNQYCKQIYDPKSKRVQKYYILTSFYTSHRKKKKIFFWWFQKNKSLLQFNIQKKNKKRGG